jgi:hypothetical protein
MDVLVPKDGAFVETAELGESSRNAGICEVTAYRTIERNGRPPDYARRISYKFVVL